HGTADASPRRRGRRRRAGAHHRGRARARLTPRPSPPVSARARPTPRTSPSDSAPPAAGRMGWMATSTIARSASAEIEISRSRFVATAHRIGSLEELAGLVRTARRAHPDARHVCNAGIAGPHGEASRSNDDGEPAGTAGAPILSAIAGRGLTDAAVLV